MNVENDSDKLLDDFFGAEAMEYLWRIEKDALKSYMFGGTYEAVGKFFKVSRQAGYVRITKILKVARFYQHNLSLLMALEVISDLMSSDVQLTKDEWILLRDLIAHRKTGRHLAKQIGKSEGWVSGKIYEIRDKISESGSEDFLIFVDEFLKMKELRSTKYFRRKKT